MKSLIREIVLSRTWQQSSSHRAEAAAADPDEPPALAHANRRRLDAEQLRDTILASAAKLDRRLGGTGMLGADGGEIDANTTAAQNLEYGYMYPDTRRSVYTPAFRNNRLELFSRPSTSADTNSVTGQRNVSTVAPQALYLLNHPFVIEQARLAAERPSPDLGDDGAHRASLPHRPRPPAR